MDKENLWLVCEHILTGSANEILLRRDKIALCKLCTVILPVEDLQAVHESQLMALIKDRGMINGIDNVKAISRMSFVSSR